MATCPRCTGSGQSGMSLAHARRPDGAPLLSDDEAKRLQHVLAEQERESNA